MGLFDNLTPESHLELGIAARDLLKAQTDLAKAQTKLAKQRSEAFENALEWIDLLSPGDGLSQAEITRILATLASGG